MWIARRIYDSVNESRIRAEAVQKALEQQNIALQAHLEWMRIRLTELGFERAQLLKKYMGVDVPVASFEPADPNPDFNQTFNFEDMGDKEAARLGISHNPDGTLSYAKA